MTKIWNASRFIMLNHNKDFSEEIDYDNIDNFDKWILSSLDDTIREVNKSFDRYQFNEAIKKIYDFTWNEFCNWYIEIVKDRFNSSNLTLQSNAFNISKYVIKKILLLLHPISPFISEEIWNHLKDKSDKDIIISKWPSISKKVKSYDSESIKDFKEIVTSIRTIRSELNIAPSKKIDIIVSVKSDLEINTINNYVQLIRKLSNTDKIDLGIKIEKPSNSALAVCRIAEIYIPLGELVDKKEEILKLNKRLSELDKLIASIEAKLSNKQFIDKAPEKVVDGEKNKLNDFIIEREKILSNIEVLK